MDLHSRPVLPEERPDLPALERVTEHTWGSVTALVVMIVLTLALSWLLLTRFPEGSLASSADPFSPLGLALYLGTPGMVGVLLWLGLRLVRGEFAWSTDPEGLEARGLFHRRRLRWTEIRTLRVTGVRDATDWYHFTGPAGTISFPASLQSVLLCASAWQHLRRCGKHTSLHPWDESVWDELPVVATANRWSTDRPVPRSLWVAALVPYAIMVVSMTGVAVLSWNQVNRWGMLMFTVALGTLAVTIAWVQCRRMRACAHSCILRDEGLEVETGTGSTRLEWDEITRVYWRIPATDTALLVIRAESPHREFVLPVGRSERAAVPVLFAILERLRYAEPAHAVALPHWLRESVDTPCNSKCASKGRTPVASKDCPGS